MIDFSTQSFRQYMAAETAAPVIACAACLLHEEMNQWFFAGVARSKSVREIDDGVGPTTDEFFTLSIGTHMLVVYRLHRS